MMFKRALIVSTLGLALAAPAFAEHCPLDARAIDQALARSTLSQAHKEEIKHLRYQGMRLHHEGDHEEAQKVLAKAMRMLLESKLR